MQKKFRISVDGRAYTVVVEELSDAVPAAAAPAPIPGDQPASAVLTAPPPAAAPAAGAGDEVAPLAGVVVSIEVGIGQAVKAGDKIAIIEAMKMKTDVFAKRSGTVTAIAVKPHDGVETGQPLLTVG